MNIAKPTTRHRLQTAALAFACLGVWTTVAASTPGAIELRVEQAEATAKPNVEALREREAVEGQKTPAAVLPPQGTQNQAPAKPVNTPRVIKNAKITYYEAVAAQTDSTPCIGAMAGVDFCDPPFPIVANNCLALGTEVEILGKRYTVADRKNARYSCEWFDVLNGKGLPNVADVEVL